MAGRLKLQPRLSLFSAAFKFSISVGATVNPQLFVISKGKQKAWNTSDSGTYIIIVYTKPWKLKGWTIKHINESLWILVYCGATGTQNASWTSIIYHTVLCCWKWVRFEWDCAKMSEIEGSRSERVRLHYNEWDSLEMSESWELWKHLD